jgi:hypothetical protein
VKEKKEKNEIEKKKEILGEKGIEKKRKNEKRENSEIDGINVSARKEKGKINANEKREKEGNESSVKEETDLKRDEIEGTEICARSVREKTEIEECVIVTEVVNQTDEIVKLEKMNKIVKEIVIETGTETGREELTTEIDQVRKIKGALRRMENLASRTSHHLKMCKRNFKGLCRFFSC